MPAFTLDDIREAADQQYGSTDIAVGDTPVKLLNVLRLSKEKRAEFTAVQKRLTSDDNVEDQADILADAIRVLAETKAQATTLLDAVGDDLALLAQIFKSYSEGTSAGEA